MNFKAQTLLLFTVLTASFAQAKSTCYIGDSQSASQGALFDKLRSRIESASDLKAGLAVCGASIQSYKAGGKKGCAYRGVTHLKIQDGAASYPQGPGLTASVTDLCAKADTVIVQLGDNNLPDPAGAAREAKALATQILSQKKACIWIGPASIASARCAKQRKQKEVVSSAIKSALAGSGCKFIDSFEATRANPPSSNDPMCIHYPGSYQSWGAAIAPTLTNALSNGAGSSTKPAAKPPVRSNQ